MSTVTETVYKAQGTERILTVLLVNHANFTADSGNYWTFTLRVVRDGQSYGELVGEYGLDDRSLTSGEPVTLYDDPRGLAMSDGDQLRSTAASTGSPVAMTRPAYLVKIQKVTR